MFFQPWDPVPAMIIKHIVRTFIYCFIVTVVIAAGLTFADPQNFINYLISSFIFTMCIGFSIHVLSGFVIPRIAKLLTVFRLGILLVVFLTGGLIGTGISVEIHKLILHYSFTMDNYIHLLYFNLLLSIIFGSVAVLYYTLKDNAERMASELKEKELNEEKLTRLKMKAELEALQAKINPHFLFNTLNSIAGLISENPKAAESTVEKLSDLFRYTLKDADKSTVTIGEELEIVRTYLEIEKVRFGDRLQYAINYDGSMLDIQVPALLIQPLVENSIKHGIAKDIQGGNVLVEVRKINNKCRIMVQDTGKEFIAVNKENGFGMRSIQERLKYMYADEAALEIIGSDPTQIVITIPIP
jgi:two-component system, LytTR family, sensor kinase